MSILIFSGSNDRAIIAFCRYASRRTIHFDIVANGAEDYIFDTDYANKVIATRKKNNLEINDVINFCNQVKQKNNSENVLILPTTEYLNRFLLKNSEELYKLNISFGLCDKTVYEKISDKYTFGNICKANEINVPKEYSTPPEEYPFLIKPKNYSDNLQVIHDRPAIIENKDQLNAFLQKKDNKHYYYQEYIGGESYYFLYYIYKNGDYSVYSQKNLIQQHNGGSMILCRSSMLHKDRLAKKFAEVFSSEGFYGLVMVEVKLYKDELYMIEANPRFWGPSQLINDAQMNLFDCFCFDNDHLTAIPEQSYLDAQWYFWSGGICSNQKEQKTPIFYELDSSNFFNQYSNYLQNEVYLKKDSLAIYLKENTINYE